MLNHLVKLWQKYPVYTGLYEWFLKIHVGVEHTNTFVEIVNVPLSPENVVSIPCLVSSRFMLTESQGFSELAAVLLVKLNGRHDVLLIALQCLCLLFIKNTEICKTDLLLIVIIGLYTSLRIIVLCYILKNVVTS